MKRSGLQLVGATIGRPWTSNARPYIPNAVLRMENRVNVSKNLSLRTSDGCHWCGNPLNKGKQLVFFVKNVRKLGRFPRHCARRRVSSATAAKRRLLARDVAHWLGMTWFFDSLKGGSRPSPTRNTGSASHFGDEKCGQRNARPCRKAKKSA